MATLIAVLQRMWSRSDAPEWILAAKRSHRTAESIEAEVRSIGLRALSAPPVVRTSTAPVPVLTSAAIDAENRRRLLSVGREVYRDKSFRDSITERFAERVQHATRLEDIRNLGRVILGDEN